MRVSTIPFVRIRATGAAVVVCAALALAFVLPSAVHGQVGGPVEITDVRGTGDTTGDIIGLTLHNPFDEERSVTLGPLLIPPTGDFQG